MTPTQNRVPSQVDQSVTQRISLGNYVLFSYPVLHCTLITPVFATLLCRYGSIGTKYFVYNFIKFVRHGTYVLYLIMQTHFLETTEPSCLATLGTSWIESKLN